MTAQFYIRHRKPCDDAWLIGCWASHIRHRSPFNSMCSEEFDHHMDTIRVLVAQESCSVAVDDPESDLPVIYGGIVCRPGEVPGYTLPSDMRPDHILHWLFVGKAFRGCGVARSLLAEELPNIGDQTTIVTSPMSHFSSLRRKWNLAQQLWTPEGQLVVSALARR